MATKHYNQVKDIKDSKVLKTFDIGTWEKAAQDAAGSQNGDKAKTASVTKEKKDPIVRLQGGLLFDTISVHTGINMAPKEELKNRDAQAVLQNVLKQFDLRFTLVLPTGWMPPTPPRSATTNGSLPGSCPWEKKRPWRPPSPT